jgi:hypothetical protein
MEKCGPVSTCSEYGVQYYGFVLRFHGSLTPELTENCIRSIHRGISEDSTSLSSQRTLAVREYILGAARSTGATASRADGH